MGNTRKFVVKDYGYFFGLLALQAKRIDAQALEANRRSLVLDDLLFKTSGTSAITPRAILFHFDKVLKLAKVINVKTRNIVPYSVSGLLTASLALPTQM